MPPLKLTAPSQPLPANDNQTICELGDLHAAVENFLRDIDENGDGIISPIEENTYLREDAGERLLEKFQVHNGIFQFTGEVIRNQHGLIDIDATLAQVARTLRDPNGPDRNGDGRITADEVTFSYNEALEQVNRIIDDYVNITGNGSEEISDLLVEADQQLSLAGQHGTVTLADLRRITKPLRDEIMYNLEQFGPAPGAFEEEYEYFFEPPAPELHEKNDSVSPQMLVRNTNNPGNNRNI